MEIRNYARTSVIVFFYANSYRGPGSLPLPKGCGLMDGERKSVGTGQDSVQFEVKWARDGIVGDVLYDSKDHNGRKFSNTHTMIVTTDPNNRVVDWSDVKSKWLGHAQQVTHSQDAVSEAVENGVAVAAALLSGLATALSAMGPKGALAAGLSAGLGQLLLIAFDGGQKAPPPPPNLNEIEGVVQRVVASELDKQDAGRIASNLLYVTGKFLSEANEVYGQLQTNRGTGTPKDIPAHDRDEIERFAEDIWMNTAQGTFMSDMNYLSTDPEVAKFVLPAYLTGIATAAHLIRLHELIRSMAVDNATGEVTMNVQMSSVDRMISAMSSYLRGLDSAIQSYIRHRDELVAREGLLDTPLREDLEALIDNSILGIKSLSALRGPRGDLQIILNLLEDDKAKGRPNHFWTGFDEASA